MEMDSSAVELLTLLKIQVNWLEGFWFFLQLCFAWGTACDNRA